MVIGGVKGDNQKKKIDFGIVVLLLFLIVFFGRCINIVSKNNERGGLAYVQMLNFTLPFVESQVYDEGAYLENNLSIKNICLEAIGLNDISTERIVNNEIPILRTDNRIVQNDGEQLDIFQLNDDSILKYKDDEKNKNSGKGAYDPSLKKNLNNAKPEVLIYHTHTSENYAESKKPTSNPNYSVVGVGNVVADELQNKYGISVIHDKTVHDISYNDSYKRSRETVKQYSDKFGNDFKLVVDLHRDAVSNKNAVTTTINGEKLARIMFVNTKNSKRFAENDKTTKALNDISNELFPGLSRKILTYNHGSNYFNQDFFDHSTLIECGANSNTSEEAQTTGKYIARIIAEYVNGKK